MICTSGYPGCMVCISDPHDMYPSLSLVGRTVDGFESQFQVLLIVRKILLIFTIKSSH